MTPANDSHARAYRVAELRREIDRALRGVHVCGHCGGEYQPGADGRRRHRMVLGHTPAQREETP